MVLKVPFVYFMDVITGETSLCRPCLLQNFLVCNDIFHSQRMPSREGALVLFVSFEFTAQILYILIKCKLNKSIRYLFCGGNDSKRRISHTKEGSGAQQLPSCPERPEGAAPSWSGEAPPSTLHCLPLWSLVFQRAHRFIA